MFLLFQGGTFRFHVFSRMCNSSFNMHGQLVFSWACHDPVMGPMIDWIIRRWCKPLPCLAIYIFDEVRQKQPLLQMQHKVWHIQIRQKHGPARYNIQFGSEAVPTWWQYFGQSNPSSACRQPNESCIPCPKHCSMSCAVFEHTWTVRTWEDHCVCNGCSRWSVDGTNMNKSWVRRISQALGKKADKMQNKFVGKH